MEADSLHVEDVNEKMKNTKKTSDYTSLYWPGLLDVECS